MTWTYPLQFCILCHTDSTIYIYNLHNASKSIYTYIYIYASFFSKVSFLLGICNILNLMTTIVLEECFLQVNHCPVKKLEGVFVYIHIIGPNNKPVYKQTMAHRSRNQPPTRRFMEIETRNNWYVALKTCGCRKSCTLQSRTATANLFSLKEIWGVHTKQTNSINDDMGTSMMEIDFVNMGRLWQANVPWRNFMVHLWGNINQPLWLNCWVYWLTFAVNLVFWSP